MERSRSPLPAVPITLRISRCGRSSSSPRRDEDRSVRIARELHQGPRNPSSWSNKGSEHGQGLFDSEHGDDLQSRVRTIVSDVWGACAGPHHLKREAPETVRQGANRRQREKLPLRLDGRQEDRPVVRHGIADRLIVGDSESRRVDLPTDQDEAPEQ